MPSEKISILLTGTIKPKNVPDLKRVNFLEREEDYYLAIKKWMTLEYPIIFVENSGYKSVKIQSLFEDRKDCEYIQFKSEVSHLGKSHGEAEIIKFAFDFSKLLIASELIVKSSGRQYISNSHKMILSTSEENVFVLCWLKQYMRYADSRFFIGKKDFYLHYLIKELQNINESKGIYLEHVLAKAIHRCIADDNMWALPKEYPVCEGISGTENIKYKTTFF